MKLRSAGLVLVLALAFMGVINISKPVQEMALTPTTFEEISDYTEVCVDGAMFGATKMRNRNVYSRPMFPIMESGSARKHCPGTDIKTLDKLGYSVVIGACIDGWKYARVYSHRYLQIIPLFKECRSNSKIELKMAERSN